MRFLTFATASALLLSKCNAHYVFANLINNGEVTPAWKYVREVQLVDNDFPEDRRHNFDSLGWPYKEDFLHANFTCGRAAFDAAARTATADVRAGQEIGFQIGLDQEIPPALHGGPAQFYIARAPNDDLATFHGQEGNWVKLATRHLGQAEDGYWNLGVPITSIKFTVPLTTPPGKYLLRIEQFWPSSTPGVTQFYINCAHINIVGPGGGSFDGYDFAKFPGTYKHDSPGVLAWLGPDYVAPGPAIWQG